MVLQVLSATRIKAWKQAECDKDVFFKMQPLTMECETQLTGESNEFYASPDSESDEVKVKTFTGHYLDAAARYCVIDIKGLIDKGSEFEIVLDTLNKDHHDGMPTRVRKDCWDRLPRELKQEIYEVIPNIGDLGEKEREELGFTLDLPQPTSNNVKDVSETTENAPTKQSE